MPGSLNYETHPRAAPEEEEEEKFDIADPAEYVAFHEYRVGGVAGKRLICLDIRTKETIWPTPAYSWLLYTAEDGEAGTYLGLVYSFMQVRITGRNLRPVAAAIKRHRCSVLWEFNPDKWPKPTDTSAPFIESIEIRATQGEMFGQNAGGGKKGEKEAA